MNKCLGWVTLSYLAVATDRVCNVDLNKYNGEAFSLREGDTNLAQK